jgi:hypothetical protein
MNKRIYHAYEQPFLIIYYWILSFQKGQDAINTMWRGKSLEITIGQRSIYANCLPIEIISGLSVFAGKFISLLGQSHLK